MKIIIIVYINGHRQVLIPFHKTKTKVTSKQLQQVQIVHIYINQLEFKAISCNLVNTTLYVQGIIGFFFSFLHKNELFTVIFQTKQSNIIHNG